MKYSPPLDGIRALAILAVLVYHAFPGALPGGFTGVDVFFALLNLSNVYIWKSIGGYWGDTGEYAPFLHTWSLAVEEQFYLVFPALLLLLARRRPGLELLRVDDAFTLPDGSVRYAEGRRFYYADDDHLAQAGAEHVSARLATLLAGNREAAPHAPEALARLAARKPTRKS